jgi:hypothetical protein
VFPSEVTTGPVGPEKMVGWVKIRCVEGLSFCRSLWAALSPYPPKEGGVPARALTPKSVRG